MGVVISLFYTFRESTKNSRSKRRQQKQQSQSPPNPALRPPESSPPEHQTNRAESQPFSPTQAQEPPGEAALHLEAHSGTLSQDQAAGRALPIASPALATTPPTSTLKIPPREEEDSRTGAAPSTATAHRGPTGLSCAGTADQGNPGTMASDEDYLSFLDKANQDPNKGAEVKGQSSGGKMQFKAKDTGAKIPSGLQKVTKDAFYVSDADEPFEPVCLKLGGGKGDGLPDEAAFAKLINHPSPKDAEVSILDISEWDTQGLYKELVEATREAAKGGDVRVYRIQKDGSRAEYWLVGVADGKLVGVKALAVES